MNKKYMIAMSIIIILSVFAFISYKSVDLLPTETVIKPSFETKEIHFADNYISFVIEDGTTVTFNLFGLQDVSTDSPSIFESVNYIEFNNNNIKIVDYEISQGDIFGNDQLFNLLVDIQLNSDEVEKVEEITIHYAQGKSQTFPFGSMMLKNDKEFNQQVLELTGLKYDCLSFAGT